LPTSGASSHASRSDDEPAERPAEAACAKIAPMTVGSVLGEAWNLYTRFFARFFVLSAVVFLITNLASAVLFEAIGTESTAAAGLVGLAATAVIVVGTYWLQGALVFAVQDVRDGSFDASNDEILHKVKPFLGTLVVAGLLGGLGIALGIVLLIVPGLVLLTWWALISPVVVLERKGVGEAFGRSRELVRGNGWTVFGVMVITTLLSAIGATVLSALLGFLPAFLEQWLGGTIAGAVVAPFTAIAVTLMYFQLAATGAAEAPAP